MTEHVAVICEHCGEIPDGGDGHPDQWGARACRAAQAHANACKGMVSVERAQTNVIEPTSRATWDTPGSGSAS
jgi:hypothetical protein